MRREIRRHNRDGGRRLLRLHGVHGRQYQRRSDHRKNNKTIHHW
jgi:hypothetical protein